uniref:Uncharacterized protein n=1 Tax=Arundo donax TaxID=35708 RepID=A0A0A9CLM7_ARUDO
MISRTEDSQVAKVLSENSDTSNVVHSSALGHDRGTIHKTNLNHPSKNVPSYSSIQQSLKSSINPTNCHQVQGGSSP